MNNLPRVSISAGRLGYMIQHQSNYVCVQCRHQLQKASIATSAPRKAQSQANGKVPYTEQIRRRIWGSETPPGPEDPYGNRSALDKTQNKGKEPAASEALPDVNASPTTLDAQAGYVPATSWDGLEHIGGATGWWEEAWDREYQFKGFMSSSKLVSRGDLENAIRRAVIEVYTLMEAGRSPADATNALDDRIIPDISSVRFSVAHDGSLAIIFPDEQTRQALLDSTMEAEPIEEVLEVEDESIVSEPHGTANLSSVQTTRVDHAIPVRANRAENVEAESSKDQSWLNASLKDPVIKFAVFKRVMQLTGRRIPDPLMGEINNAKTLLNHMVIKPKPKKLAESLLGKENLVTIPNVEILDRRYTPIDREKEVGRWKVIEKELHRRGLPVTGRL